MEHCSELISPFTPPVAHRPEALLCARKEGATLSRVARESAPFPGDLQLAAAAVGVLSFGLQRVLSSLHCKRASRRCIGDVSGQPGAGRAASDAEQSRAARSDADSTRKYGAARKTMSQLLETTVKGGIATLRFNNPRKLNAWSQSMMKAKRAALAQASANEEVKAVVLTGTGDYYCAGVDLAAVLKPMMPGKLVKMLKDLNEELFDQFIRFDKPIFAAVNGPAIGAAVTSSTLCDGIIASNRATFHTPFASLGLVPEGCSSVLFPELLGDELAQKMLNENYKLSAEEAAKTKMLTAMVQTGDAAPAGGIDEALLDATYAHVDEYLTKNGTQRSRSSEETARLREVNAQESAALADAFVSPPFFHAMEANAERRGRTNAKLAFQTLRVTRPVWGLFL
ncbi:Enoyl-CoA delta isomerase 2, mitochondrial [Hondaea fermentalgiana]|uniref:Enoyl-CoA delta isomerase 2, mitochondrial n=1 Tax=Hondaea fermentalgiana TaxID=2315210 RepID=A0A2R5GW90_9STRA|nr:Enoyl-CoA delta isomerase 2, mitochondrial [Hondaea fermentalgiana]|eukprot:GBG32681.1 Enoyl-CoA delta isomerase 2, mitochondrial [Hondaea fermentalgiana]